VIVSLHVATGAVGGTLTRSRTGAIALGLVLHALGDRIPHEDFESQRFEIWSGVACLSALALRYGPFSPVTIGAAASAAPDLEHAGPLKRPEGDKLFPTHRIEGWHGRGGITAMAQLALAGAIIGVLLARR